MDLDDRQLEKLVLLEFIENLPIHDKRRNVKIWPRTIDLQNLYTTDLSEIDLSIRFDKTKSIDQFEHFFEIPNDKIHLGEKCPEAFVFPCKLQSDEEKNETNFTFDRQTKIDHELDELFANFDQNDSRKIDFDSLNLYSDSRSIPPGFDQGVNFDQSIDRVDCDQKSNSPILIDNNQDGLEKYANFRANDSKNRVAHESIVKEMDQNQDDSDLAEILAKPISKKTDQSESITGSRRPIVIDLESTSRSKITTASINNSGYQYAKYVDVNLPVKDFSEKVPVLAYEYPFELDIFQKRAVMHLEQGETVFVAAHTSAGKTVVAEYAIALCRRHLTRAIYTSPIKALSNQKFRDFKLTFKNVGLITGDIQLNPTAFCLIMTTEILRSMLLNKSEVLRNLEWVIFDEVHYINDAERGVVWEEVLIFLPRTVKIIMLSATVYNTMEFADWVGRIKERNVYVISTPKRPVPLEHFLYTGWDAKTKANIFLLIDKNGRLKKDGYLKAQQSKAVRMTGSKNVLSTAGNINTEKNLWVHFLTHLNAKDLLPAVVFTFSRRRCDQNAHVLTSLDLTTGEQKSHVHHFFTRCMEKLKGTDKELPQVKNMAELCKRGLAVHHSGILPILKETVEMLFQRGYIKVLFATETFAMGVNMPARTVVFDSTRKNDGSSFRDLLPGEYTQMAGRAGRRGLDPTGSVFIVCKRDVPELHTLEQMILGKPAQLISQFRVTYPLILNLLRSAEELKMEEVLKGSFAESATWRDAIGREEKKRRLQQRLANWRPIACDLCCSPTGDDDDQSLRHFYALCKQWSDLKRKLRRELNMQIRHVLFAPGRYVELARNRFGLIIKLSSSPTDDQSTHDSSTNQKNASILIITFRHDAMTSSSSSHREYTKYFDQSLTTDSDKQFFDLIFDKFKNINKIASHVTTANNQRERDIVDNDGPKDDKKDTIESKEKSDAISSKATTIVLQETYDCMQISPDDVIRVYKTQISPAHLHILADDIRKRRAKHSRFSKLDERVVEVIRGVKSTMATLHHHHQRFSDDREILIDFDNIDLLSKINNNLDIELLTNRIRSVQCELTAATEFACLKCPHFEQHFINLHNYEKLKQAYDELSSQNPPAISNELQLSPDYAAKLQTLKDLGYVDQRNLLTLKGKVACYVNNFELLISEMLLDNLFSPLEPCEIAAVLSTTTCQHKTYDDQANAEENWPPCLKMLREKVGRIAERICEAQKRNGVQDNDFTTMLQYSLMRVVYEWARGTSFLDITRLTDAQEGIIVRCIMRLDETCRDVRSAARLLGDPVLQCKMDETGVAIRRDIVFAASLYTIM